ncbi:MFS general substrate transporter [Aureobasidium pullulans]|nr:MFS general substrate transporter [Aureobasidium pullulans]
MSTDQVQAEDKKSPAVEMATMEKQNSIEVGEVSEISEQDIVAAEGEYTEEQYKQLRRKIDRYLLPLMWLCYGIQQTDKTALGTQATFGLREDTGLHGQQYSWLTTVFYLVYMIFEFPSNIILQRYKMGKILSCYMICWGVVVLCIGFAQNFTHLVVLRALQGLFECCISPGFILVVGSWYKTREHASRSLVFQSANAGFGIISSLALYGIGKRGAKNPDSEPWRWMSYFLGTMTILVGVACLFLLGTPSEVKWLSPEEKRMANARIVGNNTGHDRTGVKKWQWKQVRECLIDPCFWFAGINAFLSSLPNGGLTTFAHIINTSFGFTNLQVILLDIPRSAFSVLYFVAVGLITSRKTGLRLFFMIGSTIPPFVGFLGMAFIPNNPSMKWTKWGMYFMTVPYVISLFLAWSLIPSNTAGRTKRTFTSSFTFVGYCVGNMAGSQIFKAKDAPYYIPGVIGCAICFGLEFAVLVCPYCKDRKTIKTEAEWRRHVFGDLKAYDCTVDECELHMFASSEAWMSHQLSEHLVIWSCPICDRPPFPSGEYFQFHIRMCHPAEFSKEQLEQLTTSSKYSADSIRASECQFCDWALILKDTDQLASSTGDIHVTLEDYCHHVCSHLEELALTALITTATVRRLYLYEFVPTHPYRHVDSAPNTQEEAAFWVPQATPDGRGLYYNTLTGIATWEVPPNMPNMPNGIDMTVETRKSITSGPSSNDRYGYMNKHVAVRKGKEVYRDDNRSNRIVDGDDDYDDKRRRPTASDRASRMNQEARQIREDDELMMMIMQRRKLWD